MKTLSQRDSRWGNYTLGKTSYTIYRYGCTTTAITMYYNWLFKCSVTPAQIAKRLEYTPDGYILWGSLKNIGLKLVNRIDHRDDNAIKNALKDPTQGCLIQVDGNHWVLGLGKSMLGGYSIADPWFGDTATSRRYRSITGEAIIDKL